MSKHKHGDLFIYHADPCNGCFDAWTGETDRQGGSATESSRPKIVDQEQEIREAQNLDMHVGTIRAFRFRRACQGHYLHRARVAPRNASGVCCIGGQIQTRVVAYSIQSGRLVDVATCSGKMSCIERKWLSDLRVMLCDDNCTETLIEHLKSDSSAAIRTEVFGKDVKLTTLCWPRDYIVTTLIGPGPKCAHV